MTARKVVQFMLQISDHKQRGFSRLHSMLWMILGLTLLITRTGFAQNGLSALEQAEETAFKQAAALVSPSLVRIDTVGGLDVVGEMLTSSAPTTGIVLTADGFIASSAFNFISKPASILVTLPDGTRSAAKLVATDRLRMITLLKIEASKLIPPQVAPKSSFKVGQWALALGRTYDSAQPSTSVGIVSALNRVWGKAIQTDAKVSPINYGGPLADVDGRVLGILAPLSPEAQSESAGIEWYDSGIGFAIPLEDVYAVLDRLKQGKDLRSGLAGFSFKSRDLFAEIPVIDRVRYNSPAHQAGFKPEDVVVRVDGKPVTRIAQIREVLGTKLEDEMMEVVVSRGGKELPAKLTLVGELHPYESAFLGVLPARNASDTEKGVVVRYVYAGSAAASAGLKAQDRILKLKGQEVASVRQLDDQISRLRPDDEVELEFSRDGKAQKKTLRLTGVLDAIPSDLPSAVTVPTGKEPEKTELKKGRFTAKLPGSDQEYWAFVPDDYNPAANYGLLVWIHPSRDSMEATIFQEWKTLCEQRGIILVAPRAANPGAWSANESDFVRDVVLDFQKNYSIDKRRIAMHSFSSGGQFAAHVVFKHRELFRGLALHGSPLRTQPPDNEPDLRVQFHLSVGERDPAARFVLATQKVLKNLKFPATLQQIPELGPKYPTGEPVQQIAKWLDALDRI